MQGLAKRHQQRTGRRWVAARLEDVTAPVGQQARFRLPPRARRPRESAAHPLTLAKLNAGVRSQGPDERRPTRPRRRRSGSATVNNLMDIIVDQEDKLDEAEALCRRLVEAKEEALGPTQTR